MPACTRQQCKKEFSEETRDTCQFHPGGPVFHEGLKYWSCCKDTNKPVLDFESFMAMPGCATGSHSEELPESSPPVVASKPAPAPLISAEGKEVYSSTPIKTSLSPAVTKPAVVKATPPLPPPREVIEEEDDLDAPVAEGTKCLRNGCKHTFVNDEVSRRDGEESNCRYHPREPIFHEGSKGYLCCKRRVLEFDEFLKIEGCKKGKHLFVKKKKADVLQEELVQCRIDHYQTPGQVRVSIFAKQVDKERSKVLFEEEQIHFDFFLAGSKRCTRTLNLYGPIDPSTSSYTVFGTKIELVLNKRDIRSWNLLEKTDADLGAFNLTFGVSGRTGTIGSKELILDESNKQKA